MGAKHSCNLEGSGEWKHLFFSLLRKNPTLVQGWLKTFAFLYVSSPSTRRFCQWNRALCWGNVFSSLTSVLVEKLLSYLCPKARSNNPVVMLLNHSFLSLAHRDRYIFNSFCLMDFSPLECCELRSFTCTVQCASVHTALSFSKPWSSIYLRSISKGAFALNFTFLQDWKQVKVCLQRDSRHFSKIPNCCRHFIFL